MRSPQEIERALLALREAMPYLPLGREREAMEVARDVLKWVDRQPSQFEYDLNNYQGDQQRRAKLDRMARKQVVQ